MREKQVMLRWMYKVIELRVSRFNSFQRWKLGTTERDLAEQQKRLASVISAIQRLRDTMNRRISDVKRVLFARLSIRLVRAKVFRTRKMITKSNTLQSELDSLKAKLSTTTKKQSVLARTHDFLRLQTMTRQLAHFVRTKWKKSAFSAIAIYR
jgi:hypothetical protein